MDRRNLIVAIVLLALLAVLFVITGTVRGVQDDADPRATTFRSTANGARALYLTLEELGVPVDRRLTAYVEADTLPAMLAVLAATEPSTPQELSALRQWIEAGGILVYAARPGDPILDTLGLRLRTLSPSDTLSGAERRAWPGERARPAPHDWTTDAPPLTGLRRAFVDDAALMRQGEPEPLYETDRGAPVAVVLRMGEGRVVAWADHHGLTNANLRESGAMLVFARAVMALRPEGAALHFDEYHHGYRAGRGPVVSTLRFLRYNRFGHAVLGLGAAGLGLLLLLGARFGSPVPPPRAERRSPLEHMDALANAYRQAGARNRARHLVLAGLARRLGRRPAASPEETKQLLESLAKRGSAGRNAAAKLLEEWNRGADADLGVLARTADRLVMEVRTG